MRAGSMERWLYPVDGTLTLDGGRDAPHWRIDMLGPVGRVATGLAAGCAGIVALEIAS